MAFPLALAVAGAAAVLIIRQRQSSAATSNNWLDNLFPLVTTNGGNPIVDNTLVAVQPNYGAAPTTIGTGTTLASNLGVKPSTAFSPTPLVANDAGLWAARPAVPMAGGGDITDQQTGRSELQEGTMKDFMTGMGIAMSIVNPGIGTIAALGSLAYNGVPISQNLASLVQSTFGTTPYDSGISVEAAIASMNAAGGVPNPELAGRSDLSQGGGDDSGDGGNGDYGGGGYDGGGQGGDM